MSDAIGTVVARVAALTRYPIKSTAGIDVSSLVLDERAAAGDRRWLVVNPDGTQVTARECHRLVLLHATFLTDDLSGALRLSAAGHPPFDVAVPDAAAPMMLVRIWDDDVVALDAGDAAAAWCSQMLGRTVRLTYLAPHSTRPLQLRYAGGVDANGRTVAFSDGAPLLLLGLPSVALLNEKLVEAGETALMDRRRFRANVWLDGLAPHAEDTWRRVRIGNVEIGIGTQCARCVLTTVDPDRAESGKEPLRTFATYRRHDGNVWFGVNATHAAPGTLNVGDEVVLLAVR